MSNNVIAQQRDGGRVFSKPDSIPHLVSPRRLSYPFSEKQPKLYHIPLPDKSVSVSKDTADVYQSQHLFYGKPVGNPYIMNFDEYSEQYKRHAIFENWNILIKEQENSSQTRPGLFDLQVDVPGGKKSAFTTIFGKPQVDLQINGTANLNAGASIQKTENPRIPEDQQTQVNPTFDQELKLNIQGTIGDKLSIQTDWDTDRAFDFMNRLSIIYDGYDDEILQRLELGNVSMETGNSLSRGGNALFGLKGEAQVGALKLTSIVSQQEGEGNTQTLTGGAKKQKISIRPADYLNDRYFFMDFFTRQQFEQNVSDPQQTGQALQITELKVWKLRESTQSNEGERQAIALADLGVRQNADSTYLPPDGSRDSFPDSLLDSYRDPAKGVSATDFSVDPSEFVGGYFIPMKEGVDYTINRNLGYIALKRNLSSRQALAISFKYRDPQTGNIISVGDVSPGGGNRIFLKLIRPQTVTTSSRLWDLMMKNVYSLGAANLTEDGLNIDIKYTEQNVPSSSLPQRSSVLLQDLGLDRVDQQGALNPDNKIDFSTTVLNPATGTIIFPYLQPFGGRIMNLLQQESLSQDQIDDLSFDELYNETQTNAQQNSKNNYYLIDGESSGSISASYSLGYSLVEGSVHVYANGHELQEGTDYAVDYSIGSITILDKSYLRKGQQIKIEYENNDLTQIGKKNFTGVRAQYNFTNNISLGGTYFKLKEKPLQDKIRLGNEPVNNSVLGLDANADFSAPWLTRLIDRIPLLQTRERSNLSLNAEFAQLHPGVSQTDAVKQAISENRLFDDEKNGLSYIDDFEGSDITISFLNPSRWHLAAAPAAVPGYAPDQPYFKNDSLQTPMNTLSDKVTRSDLRSTFSWYSIPQNIDRILGDVKESPETEPVKVTDVFPNRDVLSEDNFLNTLDVYYDPAKRGPYNYNDNLKNLLEDEAERTWGGMTTTIPPGQEDLTQNNIEYLEFWVQPVLPGGKAPTAQDLQDYKGKIYVDIGTVSEDVVPNFKTNTEDGLVRRPEALQRDNLGGKARSYVAVPPPAPEGQFSNKTRSLEDVGLDGAPDKGGIDNKNEQQLFAGFLNEMRSEYGANSPEFKAIKDDPSNDDYVYYGQKKVADLSLKDRFHRMYGYHEGNTPPTTSDKRAITNKPNTEGLITPSIVEQNNSYYQYQVDWNPADFSDLNIGSKGTYIVDKIDGQKQQDRWYQVRIPLKDWIRKVGGIKNFQNISYIRIWMSGYKKPFTMRFATLQLVGSQWRNADNVDEQQGPTQGDYNISTVNIEENSQRRPIPYRQPKGAIRATMQSRKRKTIANEQSIVMNVDNLAGGELKMMKRVYPGGLNMINYSHVRMYVHADGYKNRGDAELVMRFGTDLTNNYYEYRQPVSPSDPTYPYSDEPLRNLSSAERQTEAKQVWLYKKNSLNILLKKFNELKQLRDQQQADPTQPYQRSDILNNAPPGAILAIKGNPSLDRVGEIGMGIENPFNPQNPGQGGISSLDGHFWFNELRVSGFDNKSGWAADAKAQIKLADFATVNANFNRQTDGFGSLNSRLGQRRLSNTLGYNLTSTVNMNKFIPQRYGWNIPVTFSTRHSSTTPRYLPNQGDVRLSEFKDAVNARTDINSTQKQHIIDQRVHNSQTVSDSYSINISNLTKSNSRSLLAKYTLDKTTFNYVYNNSKRRSPQYFFRDNWNYSGSLRYNVRFRNTKLFRPFGFLGKVPLLNPLARLQLGYTPASIDASAGIDRNYNKQRRRVQASKKPTQLQQTHSFTYHTDFGFDYNLTPSIKTTFQSRTLFDLSRAGIKRHQPDDTMADSTTYSVRPTFDVLQDLVFDSLSSRRTNYDEAYTASWQPNLNSIDALRWFNYSANYNGGYQWRNSSRGSGLGANISNNLALNQSLNFDLEHFLGSMSWVQNLRHNIPLQTSGDSAAVSASELGHIIKNIGRKSLAALLSFESLDVSFDITKNALQTGYRGDSQLFYMFNGGGNSFSPPFSYRTGITDDIGVNNLIDNPNNNTSLQLPSNRDLRDKITVDSRLRPFPNVTVDLSLDSQWNLTNTKSITKDINNNVSVVRAQNGKIISSVWAFGSGYEEFFRRQLSTAFDDIGQDNKISDATGNNDGRSVLGKRALQEDFRKAYLGFGQKAVGKHNFTPFPLPAWRITWTGLESFIPYFGPLMAHVSLTHSYEGEYRLGWVFNENTEQLPDISLGNYSVINQQPSYEPSTINIQKKFNPLIGLNITWLSNLRTNLKYESSKTTSLSLSNSTVIENLSKGLTFTLGYTVQNFKIPFLSHLENAVDFTLNGSYIEDIEKKYVLNSDLDEALSSSPPNISKRVSDYNFSRSFTGGQSRIKASAIVGYQFSQIVKANFEYDFNKLIPQSSSVYARTDQDILFNVVVSIRSD